MNDADRCKEEGNVTFKTGRLDDATEKYTRVLVYVYICLPLLCPHIAILFIRRIGENEDEGEGYHIRDMLLFNWATTIVKVYFSCLSRWQLS